MEVAAAEEEKGEANVPEVIDSDEHDHHSTGPPGFGKWNTKNEEWEEDDDDTNVNVDERAEEVRDEKREAASYDGVLPAGNLTANKEVVSDLTNKIALKRIMYYLLQVAPLKNMLLT